MIGQSQVTEPLMTALRTNRVNHAYLFSGPRGCGKTTSARILARCLNCAEGPTDTPCGVCPSCVELSRDGGGSLDVVEIDAASHNGVDDARDIRERAIFAPARDRYKIFILDEAHMVTPQGFNALLKIVEEPPEHVKFIFATTEPEKVIGTIRSRTHHYPFRLVPPAPMLEYVQKMCEAEGMQVAPGVLPLVVRAGGGSPRDTLSLLDQLMAGSDSDVIEYERAVALLGYTHASLLDEAIDAIAAREPSDAFDAVDRVIQTGQDPRRFVEDLLERMRDLIVVAATSAAGAAAVLRGVPQDELDRMAAQAAKFGPAELSRTADILNAALTEMTGATSPRLHLELMIARVLIPASDDSTRGALARVERLERRIGVNGSAATTTDAAPASSPSPESAPAVTPLAPPDHTTLRPAAQAAPGAPVALVPAAPVSTATTPAAVPAAAPRLRPVGPVTLQQVKDAWPEVLEAVKAAKFNAWLVLYTARAMELRDGELLVLSFPSQKDVEGLKQSAAPGQGVGDHLKKAVNDVLGFTPKLTARVDASAGSNERVAAPSAAPTAEVPNPVAPVESPPQAESRVTDASAARTAGGTGSAAAKSKAKSNAGADAGPPADEEPAADADPEPAAEPQVAAAASASADGPAAAAAAAAASAESESESDADATAAVTVNAGAPTSAVTGWATAVIPSSPAASAGWATVTIPGSAPAEAPTEAPEPTAVSAQASASASPHATRPAPSTARASEREPEAEPPFDEEPPPFDDEFPPDPQADGAESARFESAGPAAAARAAAPGAASAVSAAPGAAPAAAPASATGGAASGPRRGPAFAEKQRYGESVVREILGATFLEEQAHEPASRQRGD
jgi:DNA polymerase-3 subunit gamma/tau